MIKLIFWQSDSFKLLVAMNKFIQDNIKKWTKRQPLCQFGHKSLNIRLKQWCEIWIVIIFQKNYVCVLYGGSFIQKTANCKIYIVKVLEIAILFTHRNS